MFSIEVYFRERSEKNSRALVKPIRETIKTLIVTIWTNKNHVYNLVYFSVS